MKVRAFKNAGRSRDKAAIKRDFGRRCGILAVEVEGKWEEKIKNFQIFWLCLVCGKSDFIGH